jgi:hypothetical protein
MPERANLGNLPRRPMRLGPIAEMHRPSRGWGAHFQYLTGVNEMPQRTAELVTARTSADCISYRLYTAPEGITDAPRLLWSNRVYDRPEGHAGARRRAQAWARQHGYRMVEQQMARVAGSTLTARATLPEPQTGHGTTAEPIPRSERRPRAS